MTSDLEMEQAYSQIKRQKSKYTKENISKRKRSKLKEAEGSN